MANADAWVDFSDRERDLLGRWAAVDALRRMLAAEDLVTPMALGVYGGWGVGKTSVMRTLQTALKGPNRLILWFDSWVYATQQEALWRALLLCVVEALRARTKHPDDLHVDGKAYAEAKKEFDFPMAGCRGREESRRRTR
jgi:predicted KAP-like P-loop ATPase